jgi:hypothetical protein
MTPTKPAPVFHPKLLKSFCLYSILPPSFPPRRLSFELAEMVHPCLIFHINTELESSIREGIPSVL